MYTKTTVQTGDVITATWANHIQTQFDEAVADAAAAVPIVPIDRITATTQVVSTDQETTLYSKTITGGLLGTNGGLRLALGGDYRCDFAGVSVTVRVKFGVTTLFSVLVQPADTGTSRYAWRLDVLLQNTAANAQRAIVLSSPMTDLTELAPKAYYGVATEGTATNRDLTVTVTLSMANPAVDWSARHGVLELIRPT